MRMNAAHHELLSRELSTARGLTVALHRGDVSAALGQAIRVVLGALGSLKARRLRRRSFITAARGS